MNNSVTTRTILLLLFIIVSINTKAQTLAEKIANRQQLTNLATVYFDIPDAYGKDINSVLFKDRATNTADYHQTTIQVVENGCNDGTGRPLGNFTEAGLEIKVRGNSTAEMDKRPYRLRFYKDEKDAAGNVTASHKHDMLGYGYEKRNWTILNNLRDGSLMQNAITYYIGKAVGMPFCPGYKFVDLVINGEYRGNYMLSDHVEVGSHRIEVDENTGWFVESTRNDMVEEPYFNDAALYVLIKSPESKTAEGTAAIKEMIRQYFINNNNNFFGIWTNACDDATFCDPIRGWRSVFDEESLVRFYVGLELTGDSDGMMQVKMYREEDGKMQFGPLWDKDLAFGVQDDGKTLAEGNSLEYGAPTFNNYIKKIMKTDPVFVKRVHDKLHEVIDNGYINNMMAEIDKIEASLLQSKKLEYNNTGWKAVSVEGYPAAVERLRQYIKDHTAWLVGFIDERYESMGGDNIQEPTPNPGGESGEDGGSTNQGPEYEVEYNSGIVFNSWEYKALPANLFLKNATSAEIKVKGAVFVCISKTNNESGAIAKFAWNDANKTGVSYTLEGENLALAKQGRIYVGTNQDESIVLTVTNHGTPDTPDPPTPSTRKQLTNVPTIYLDAEKIGNDWSSATVEVFDKDNKLTQGTNWTATLEGVQYQGSGAAGSKNSYRLKFASKTKLLASGKFKQWVLASNDDDPSMINNAMAKELGDIVGMPFTPGYQFVDLYVNDTYMGTYQVTDRVKAESGRALVADGNKDNDWHVRINDDDEITEGNYNANDYVRANSSMPNLVIKNPDPDDLTAEQIATLKSEMEAWFKNMFAKDANGHYINIEEKVDKQQLINWYICQEVLAIYKGLSSVEAYRSVTSPTDKKFHFGPLWDNETAFGNRGESDDKALSMNDLDNNGSYNGLIFNYNKYGLMKEFIKDLWTQEWFKTGVPAKWNQLVNAGLLNNLKNKANAISATLNQTQKENIKVWPNSLKTRYNTYSNYSDAVAAINKYLAERIPYLTKKFNALGTACTNHTYNEGHYVSNGDGTYSLTCDKCGEKQPNGPTYYKYTVYAESSAAETVYNTSKAWRPDNGKPNTLIYVEDAAGIDGTNVVQTTAATCSDFVLTDGHPFYNPNNFAADKVSYSRNMNATSNWGTVCLPFKIVTGDDVTVYHLTASDTDGNGNGTMVFTKAEEGTGGLTPLIYKKNHSGATSVSFTGGAQKDNTYTVKEFKDYTDITYVEESLSSWIMHGNVGEPVTISTSATANPAVYYIASDKFWHATGNLAINPFRAYFTYSYEAGSKPTTFSISEGNEETSLNSIFDEKRALAVFLKEGGISVVAPKNMDVTIYSANGSAVSHIKTEANNEYDVNLPQGVYVVNGLKFIVK